jgi:hypothetical protein
VRFRDIRALLVAALLGFPGLAAPAFADICPGLTRLLTAPPSGFIAARGEPTAPQYWAAKPIVADAKCRIWQSAAAEAHNMRCVVNDEAAPESVAEFYRKTSDEIDRCLAALPGSPKFDRTSREVETSLLKGTETVWISDTPAVRFKIDLAGYRRVELGTSYDSLSVEFLKY